MNVEEQLSCIKDLCRQKILHVIQSLENARTLNITIELQEILRYLLQLSSLTCIRSCIVFVQEALQILEQLPTENEISEIEVCKRQGRKYDIPGETLQYLIESGLRVKEISELLNVSKRTVERRMEEFNLSIRQTYSNLSDNDLRQEVEELCSSFPNVGYRTIQSLLLSQGLKVQELRVRQAVRECDPCGVLFRKVFLTSCRIQRRTYSVSGPQALWHIDGNHKLIRWRLVIHGGIDGYSRFPVYLNVSNNNRADTVLYAFLEAVQQFGLPRRVRSDKGGENVLVAEYMVEHQPIVNRPFIAGRSVHNQRIERLWREVWAGVTSLYYAIFYGLENEGILDPTSEVHIMMLHLVFVPRIQTHLNRFAEALRRRPLRTENNRTPLQLWMTSRHPPTNEQVDTDVYGIDYNPETVLFHQESVEVPATMEIGDDHRQRIQDILQKDSNNLGVDIYKEILEFWTVN
ncbi:uncharacterized protein LOC128237304 isoform X1 [Mya arenaria]|uniref:uncharacterized protein LOC128202963 isoform X1 n=1 Tax=Mya arenaria TaxID=6604 RepID=UPI0022E08E98|nr:uncharacterized protein LOC128202963 isoform X1 [Mya arenaria]XP_052768958.1 uncharacterized protein LOC128209127 isoform X1 [Mya arenaria]XP_052775765.1 uncharacterized protein LOC128213759 isoform X2 [Mya arenaria]XP_052781147.1 uncharacterized protein LOC128217795 isoform X1 [Mya arenaria]XP_052808653.1 uncharacterized protein LOC128237304 isoform X1 [Mya arenaria]